MLEFSVTTYTPVRARVSIQCDPFDPIVPDISESILSEEVTVPQYVLLPVRARTKVPQVYEAGGGRTGGPIFCLKFFQKKVSLLSLKNGA